LPFYKPFEIYVENPFFADSGWLIYITGFVTEAGKVNLVSIINQYFKKLSILNARSKNQVSGNQHNVACTAS